MSLVAITSISPGHKNFENQKRAIKSWKDAGYKVVSLNSNEEIELLKESFDVEFVPTLRHNKVIFGKPYVHISAIIDYLKESKSKYSLIINSDIIIKDLKINEKLKTDSEKGIIVMNRIDFNGSMDKGNRYELGYDGFFINEKFLNIFPQSILCLGQCHWDFWLPYMATVSNVPIISLKEDYIWHESHEVQYSKINWVRTGEILRAESGIFKFNNVGQMTQYVSRQIRANLK